MSEYLTSSNFGQVAGSILSRRREDYKDRFKKAIGFSLVNNFLSQANNNLIQEKEDAINDITDKYTDIFSDKKEYYDNKLVSEQRNLYQLYKNPNTRDKAILTQAINTFNNDSELIAQYGFNPYNQLVKMKKTSDGARALSDEIERLKSEAVDYFESISDEAITSPTFVQYSEKAKLAYKAAIKEAKNDPTKKNLVRAAWLKIFGRDRDGNPRFGLIEQDKLKDARETAERIAGIASSKDVEQVTNLNKEANKKEENITKSEENTRLNFGIVPDGVAIVSRQREILMEAINKDSRNKSFLNKNPGIEFNFKRENSNKIETGTVYEYYKTLTTAQDKLNFLNTILADAALAKKDYNDTDTTGRPLPDINFVIDALQNYFEDTLNTDNQNNTINTSGSAIGFDVNKLITLNIGPDIKREVTIGVLESTLMEETNRDNAMELISIINNSTNDEGLLNHFQNIFNKQFNESDDESLMESFFEYEKRFKNNPLSIPQK